MPRDRDEKIGPTAHYTAYAWHRLGLPNAEIFATAQGRVLYWAFRGAGEWIGRAAGAPLLVDVLAYRHLLIDREIARLTPECVVEIGAGLSRRGISFAMAGMRYVEIDLPSMIRRKERLLARAPRDVRERAGGRLRLRAHDVLDAGFGEALARELEGAARAVVVAEGLLGYFALPERAQIVRAVRQGLAAAREGAFLCDLRDAERARSLAGAVRVLRGAIRLVTRGRGLREDFGSAADVRAFFAEAGFARAEPVEPAPAELAQRPMPIRVWRAELARGENDGA